MGGCWVSCGAVGARKSAALRGADWSLCGEMGRKDGRGEWGKGTRKGEWGEISEGSEGWEAQASREEDGKYTRKGDRARMSGEKRNWWCFYTRCFDRTSGRGTCPPFQPPAGRRSFPLPLSPPRPLPFPRGTHILHSPPSPPSPLSPPLPGPHRLSFASNYSSEYSQMPSF